MIQLIDAIYIMKFIKLIVLNPIKCQIYLINLIQLIWPFLLFYINQINHT